MQKKRHHYVPKAYLKAFCDDSGRVRVYRKNDPSRVIQLSPDNTAFHKYYYSQPTPDGARDNNKLEDLFSVIEREWPQILARLQRRENVNDSLEQIFQFMALQRVRVPASRDATERMLAEAVRATARAMDAAGELPPKPAGYENLLDHITVAIDPHQSIHAMIPVMQGTSTMFERIGICALHNITSRPFLTSDNPLHGSIRR